MSTGQNLDWIDFALPCDNGCGRDTFDSLLCDWCTAVGDVRPTRATARRFPTASVAGWLVVAALILLGVHRVIVLASTAYTGVGL